MLEEAAQALAETLYENESVAALYLRVDQAPLAVMVIPGRTRPERAALADGRVNFEVEPADFLMRPVDLDFDDGAGPVEPQTGDRIMLAASGTSPTRLYELSPRDGERSWRPDSAYRALYRLRTVRVKGDAVARS